MDSKSVRPDDPRPDPVFLNSLRECWVVLGIWVVCIVWTIGYCGFAGYGESSEVGILLGMPDWIVIGVVLPWFLATLFTAWFGLFFVADDDLGREGDPREAAGKEPPDA